MWLDKSNMIADGVNKTMDVAPVSINDRTMVPVRFAAENLGCTVGWNDAIKEVIIKYLQTCNCDSKHTRRATLQLRRSPFA